MVSFDINMITTVNLIFFFFKQKTAYEMCGRDWSSDVCSSDLECAIGSWGISKRITEHILHAFYHR